MGLKYSSVSDTGYNASAPSDDGTAVASNEVKWSFIKTKLADVVRTFCQDINSAILAHTDESVLDKAVTYTTVAADHKRTINVTAAVTISLGDAATMATGYIVTVKNSHTAAITVDLATGTDELDGTVDGSVSLQPKDSMTFVTNSVPDGYKKQSAYTNIFFASKASDESVTSSATLQDDDDLQVTLEANSIYQIEAFFVFYSATATPDYKAKWVAADGTWVGMVHQGVNVNSALGQVYLDETSTEANWAGLITAGGYQAQHCELHVTTGGSGGLFKLQWCQNISDATATTVKKGGWIKATKLY